MKRVRPALLATEFAEFELARAQLAPFSRKNLRASEEQAVLLSLSKDVRDGLIRVVPISARLLAHARRIAEPRPGSVDHSFLGCSACCFGPRSSSWCSSARLIRISAARGPWDFALLIFSNKKAASKRGTMYRALQGMQTARIGRASKRTCTPGAVESTGLKTRHYRDLARLEVCPPISMEFRCGGGL